MRLVYIANIRLPTEKAHGIQIMKMCEAFANARGMTRNLTRNDADNRVTLVVPTRNNRECRGADPFDFYGVERVFSVRYLKCFDPEFLMCFPGGAYIKVQRVLFARAVSKFLKSLGITRGDCVYTRDEHLLPLAQRYSDNVAWEAHALPRHPWMYRRAWLRCRMIIAISEGLRQGLLAQGIAREKIVLARDGVDIAKFQITNDKLQTRAQLKLPQDKKIVVYTGHLYEWKGAGALLEAARKLQMTNDKLQNVLFVFVGGTEKDVQDFKRKAKGLQNILIVGHKQYNEIPLWLTAADVVVLPNSDKSQISRVYTSPMKLFEYMASGVPIVASDVPSIREILGDQNAVLATPDNPDALERGIQFILSNPAAARARADQARRDAQQYDWQARAQTILAAMR